MTGGLIQVESSTANIAAGASANVNSGAIKFLTNAPGMTLSGNGIQQTERLSIVTGGNVLISENAVLEVTRSSVQAPPGSGQTSQNHPSLDFTSQFLSGLWSQVQGRICLASTGNGQVGNGALLCVLGQSETISIGGNPVSVNFESLLNAAIANGKITTNVPGGNLQVAWDGTYTKVWVDIFQASVQASYVFHPGWNGTFEQSINAGKQVARETGTPQVLSFSNLINSTLGINGLVIDIQDAGDPNAISASDFVFQVSPLGTFSQSLTPAPTWPAAPPPSSIAVIPGAPARVVIQWPSNAIANRWLRITVLNTPSTDLPAPEVFYVGHLLGETNGQIFGDAYFVTFDDILSIRQGIGSTVNTSSDLDIDKNGTVQFSDISLMRSNVGIGLSNITIP